jgi:hypothetical protein
MNVLKRAQTFHGKIVHQFSRHAHEALGVKEMQVAQNFRQLLEAATTALKKNKK